MGKNIVIDAGIRVLVVDDSAFARAAITRNLDGDPAITVIGYAYNGADAVDKVRALRPDVVTMDVSMPRMDGICALAKIMAACPTPVVMLSAHTGEASKATIDALELGAVDFFLKPAILNSFGNGGPSDSLGHKIKLAAAVPVSRLHATLVAARYHRGEAWAVGAADSMQKVVVIGSSTGGPRALARMLPGIPSEIPAALLLVQHMPSGFTGALASRLDELSAIEVKEGEEGDQLAPGRAYLAPGDRHMTVVDGGLIGLDQGPRVRGVRPAVDVTMRSAAEVYGQSCVGVVLTGMGSDGTDGANHLKRAGGRTIAQDEASCAIYGMPKSLVESGNADKVVPLGEMASEILRMCHPTRRTEIS